MEKKRALIDVYEGVEHLLGSAFPCLFGELANDRCVALRDDCVLFEASREVDHVISHIENDLLSIEDTDTTGD